MNDLTRQKPGAALWPVIVKIYNAFNARDIDTALAAMHADVDWPNGMQGGYEHGHEELREYWRRQWTMIDSKVTPLNYIAEDDNHLLVSVRLMVRDMAGNLLTDQELKHEYIFENGLIKTMEILA